MVQPSRRDAARNVALRLILERSSDIGPFAEVRDESPQRGLISHAQADMPEPRRRVRRQLQRVPLVIAPCAQVDRVAGPSGLVQPDNAVKNSRLSARRGVSSSTWPR